VSVTSGTEHRSGVTERDPSHPGELVTSRAGRTLLQARTRALPGRVVERLLYRCEQGPQRTASLRALLARDFDVHVGAHSYGPVLVPGAMPRGLSVGRYASVGPEFRPLAGDHPLDQLSLHPYWYNPELGVADRLSITRSAVRIEHEAWIGARVVATPGCTRIGIGAAVGAGTVLTRDVPDFSVVAGNPGRVLRQRFSDQVAERLLRLAWWEQPLDLLKDALPRHLPVDAAVLDLLEERLGNPHA
jgi:virginiamycin A acetyltransferase